MVGRPQRIRLFADFHNDFPVNRCSGCHGDTLHWLSAPDTLMASFEAILANDYDVDGDTIHLSREVVETGFDGCLSFSMP
jgi:hypothetical protein